MKGLRESRGKGKINEKVKEKVTLNKKVQITQSSSSMPTTLLGGSCKR